MASKHNPLQVLIVEDNPGDARLTQEALSSGTPPKRLHLIGDGEAALAFVRRQGDFTHAPRPDLILLDLNLPRCGGRDVLAALKADPALRSIPVVVLSTSDAERDVHDCYDLGANCYLVKPVVLDEFLELMRSLEQFWLHAVRLPQEE
jgi:CheY-like chemotaxis protein